MNCHHCHAAGQEETAHCTRCGKPSSASDAHARTKKAGRRRHGKRHDLESTSHQPPTARSASFPPPALLANRNDTGQKHEPPSYPLVLSSQAVADADERLTGNRVAHRPWRRWVAASLVVATAAIAFTGLSRTKENAAAIEAGIQKSNVVETIATRPADNAQGKVAVAADADRQAATQKKTASEATKPAKSTQKRQHAQSEQKKRDTTVARKATKPASEPVATDRPDNILVAAKTPAPQSRYEQCLEQDSFFSRERCKWQVCSGKWGQDGCPSYQQKTDIN